MTTEKNKKEYTGKMSSLKNNKPFIIVSILLTAAVILLAIAFCLLTDKNSESSSKTLSETETAVTTTVTSASLSAESSTSATQTTTSTTVTTTATSTTTTTTTTVTTKANIDASSYIGFWHKRNIGLERELTISSVNGNNIVFTLWYYRTGSIDDAVAVLDGDTAYFSTNDASGFMTFFDERIELTLTESAIPYMPPESMTFNARHEQSYYKGSAETEPPFESYVMQVSNPNLPIYAEPSYYSSVTGYITDQSYYTIVDEEGSWGKLKSGLGWINLIDASYTFEGGIADDGREEGEEEEVLIGMYCSSCCQKFHVSSFDSVYICPFCGHDCTYE